MCLTEEFLEARFKIIDKYSNNGHIEIYNFLSINNLDIQALYNLNILIHTPEYHTTADIYDFAISKISNNIIFYNKEYQIMLIYADKIEILRHMIESIVDTNKTCYPNIAHQFEANIKIDPNNIKKEAICIIENVIEVLNTDPTTNIDIYININSNFPGGAPDRVRDMINQNIQKISGIKYTWS